MAITNYTYSTSTQNNIALKIITSSADNICIGDCGGTKTLVTGGFYGINGAFFSGKKTMSIAVQAGTALSNGGDTNSMGHACLYYTTTGTFGWYSSISSAASLPADISWAQGGASMRFGFADNALDVRGGVTSPYTWEYCLEQEMGSGWQSGGARRTALVGDLTNKKYYMIITRTSCSAINFRKAISSYLGISNTDTSESSQWKGIMLDGGGSSAMRCSTANYATDGRNLRQIVTVKY